MICQIEGCQNPIKNWKRKLCSRCYQYWLQTEAPHKPRCPVEGCDRPVWAKGHCNIHYRRLERGGSTDGVGRGSPGVARGIRNLDGRYVNKQGYVKVKVPEVVGDGGWVLEHRYVMAKELGRDLLPGENVHHKDGNKENNDPSNLELWVTFQPAGQRPEDLLEWAEEIFRRYK